MNTKVISQENKQRLIQARNELCATIDDLKNRIPCYSEEYHKVVEIIRQIEELLGY